MAGLFTQESSEERNATLLLVTILIVLIGAIYSVITSVNNGSMRGIMISLFLILACAVIVSVGL
jgi:hypothetical protein|tara:strand:- start:173 stop:364 length:192 start_codon:yes stop_codon:yes gene_type:complete